MNALIVIVALGAFWLFMYLLDKWMNRPDPWMQGYEEGLAFVERKGTLDEWEMITYGGPFNKSKYIEGWDKATDEYINKLLREHDEKRCTW